MNTYEFDGYKMTLQDLGVDGNQKKHRVAYAFSDPNGKKLFEGRDLFASPMHDPESLESAKALLSFLTLQEGDTDDEYFDNYTPDQLEFRESLDCEYLKAYTMDDED
jgi:hypothetical protein